LVIKMKVKADIGKNRLYLSIIGQASKPKLEKLYTDVRFCVADLKPGFDVISDLSQCNLGHLGGIPTLRKIMNFLIANRAGNVVRVINGNSLVFKQILNISSMMCGYIPVYVHSLNEAEEKLETSLKTNEIRFHVNNLPVEYTVKGIAGKGNILELSTNSCAIQSATLPVSKDEEISIKIVFKQQDVTPDEFTIKTRVDSTSGNDMFAVRFMDFDDDRKDQLLRHIIHVSQYDI
jgi:hypothetical protein